MGAPDRCGNFLCMPSSSLPKSFVSIQLNSTPTPTPTPSVSCCMICCLFVVSNQRQIKHAPTAQVCVQMHINYNSYWPKSYGNQHKCINASFFFPFFLFWILIFVFINKQRKMYALFMIARHVIRMLIDKYLKIY